MSFYFSIFLFYAAFISLANFPSNWIGIKLANIANTW